MEGSQVEMRLALLLLFAVSCFAQNTKSDDHLALCHKDFLRIYRVRTIERDPQGRERKAWTRWFLIDDRNPSDKEEISDTLRFYRENHIEIEMKSLEGRLPD
jgi:hypothetical protein